MKLRLPLKLAFVLLSSCVSLTVSHGAELSASGATDSSGSYEITGMNSVAGVLTMTGDTDVDTLTITSGSTNTEWDLGSNNASIANGLTIASGSTEDYLITGGTLTGTPSLLTITNNSNNNLTIGSAIGSSALEKTGSGNVVISSVLSNTNNVSVQNGTIKFTGIQSTNLNVSVASGTTAEFTINASATLGAISGDGTIIFNKTASVSFTQGGNLGNDWTQFTGKIILDSSASSNKVCRIRLGNIGTAITTAKATVEVRDGFQYWDNSTASEVKADFILTGTGEDGFGAIRALNTLLYSGNITVTSAGAAIGAASTFSYTFSGDISGGVLSLGATSSARDSNSYFARFTLSGNNSQTSTSIYTAHVIAASETALGGGVTFVRNDRSALTLNTNITTGFINGTDANTNNALNLGSYSITLNGSSTSSYAGKVSGSGDFKLTGSSSLTLKGDISGFTGGFDISSSSSVSLNQSANRTIAGKITGSGAFTVNNSSDSITTTLTNTANDLAGAVTVQKGILELGANTKLSGSTATVATDGTIKINGESIDDAFTSISGAGNLVITNSATTLTGNALSGFSGTLNLVTNASLAVTLTSGTFASNSLSSISMAGGSTLTLNSDGTNLTVGSFKPAGLSNTVAMSGSDFTLSVTDSSWISSYTGEIIFERNPDNFTVQLGTTTTTAYDNIYVKEDGNIYQAYTDSSGVLLKLGIDMLTELPANGSLTFPSTSYRITTANPDLASNTLTMTADASINTLNIATAANNKTWDLAGKHMEIRGAQIFFDSSSTEDYLITGGTITGSPSSDKLVINQSNAGLTVTIASQIIDNTSSSNGLLLQKSGAGNLTISGALSNTGGVESLGGTLTLIGSATGTGSLATANAGAEIVLGDGINSYIPTFSSISVIADTEVTVTKAASLGSATVTNRGTITFLTDSAVTDISTIDNAGGILNFDLGTNGTMDIAGTGAGTIKVTRGKLSLTELQSSTQNVDILSNASLEVVLPIANNTSTTPSLGKISGGGNLTLVNTLTSDSSLEPHIGLDWTDFSGTLTLNSNNNVIRIQTGNIGTNSSTPVTVIVEDKGQIWDSKSTAGITQTANFVLTGTGQGNFGALRLQASGSTYSGDITITAGGAAISAANTGTYYLTGDITGGALSLGRVRDMATAYLNNFELSGDNDHDSTVICNSRVTVKSSTALGGGVSIKSNSTLGGRLTLESNIVTGFIDSTETTSSIEMGTYSITLDGASTGAFAGILNGSGALVLKNGVDQTFSGANTYTGNISLQTGAKLTLASAGAIGTTNTITMGDGTTLNLSSNAFSNQVTVENGATLSGFSAYSGNLTLTGTTAGKTVTTTNDLKANTVDMGSANPVTLSVTGNFTAATLNLGHDSLLKATGNISITNGGLLSLDASNINSATPLISANGSIAMGGTFTTTIDVDGYVSGTSVSYNVAQSGSGSVTPNSLNFSLVLPTAYQFFFSLDSDYLTQFANTGNLVVTVNSEAVTPVLILDSEGATNFTSPNQVSYLGAKEADVTFNATYTRSSGDPHYRITDGKGWFTFSPDNALTDLGSTSSTLIITAYTESDAVADSGVILTAANNTHTGGVAILNTYVKSDAETSGTVKTFGSGEVSVLGSTGVIELTTSGNDTDAITYTNNFLLSNGATLSQEAGTNTITGDITIDTAARGGTITNKGAQTLTIAGGLKGANLTVAGTSTGGSVQITGARDTADRTLNSLTLTNSAKVELTNDANLTTNTVTLNTGSEIDLGNGGHLAVNSFVSDAGGDIYVNQLGKLTIAGGSAPGNGSIYLNGGALYVTQNLNLNGTGEAKLNFLASPWLARVATTNVVDVLSGITLTLTNATSAADASFTKTGSGTILFTGNSSGFLGTANVADGSMRLTFASGSNDFGGNIVVGGGSNSAYLSVAEAAVIQGNLTVLEKGNLQTGNNLTIQGDLTVGAKVTLEIQAIGDYQGDVILGEKSSLKLADSTRLGYDGATITIGKGSTINFGSSSGSSIVGSLAAPLTFTNGSTYAGFLNAGANDIVFESGSMFNVSASLPYKPAESFTGALQSQGTISLSSGMTFELNNFTEDNLSSYVDGFTLISVSSGGTITVGGKAITASTDYSHLLGSNDYDWILFNLLSGGNANTIELKVAISAQYENVAQTANEVALVPVANELANKFGSYTGELMSLGANLALASGNSRQLLSNMALSTSSVMTAYQVQIAGLQRHSFDILNRVSQEPVGVNRLDRESHINTVWVNAIGGTYKLDSDANALGNTTNVWGGTVGYSRPVGDNLAVGLAFSYTNSEADINNGVGSANVDSYYLDAFARYNKDNWNVIAILTGGFTSSETERNMTVGDFRSHTKGSADGDQFYALLQAGYEFSLSQDDNSLLEPFAILTGGYASMDGFTESGAGNAGLQVDSQSQGLCSLGAGVRFVQNFYTNTSNLTKGRFEVRALFMQDITDNDITVNANFIGMPGQRFSQEGMSAGRSAFIFGTGVVLPVGIQTDLFADVDAEFRSSETGIRANVGVRVAF